MSPEALWAVKIDVKSDAAYEQLVPMLEKYSHVFENRVLILNESFNSHALQDDPKVAAVRQIKEAIPNTVVSIAINESADLTKASLPAGLGRIQNALGDGVYTLAVHSGQRVNADLMAWMQENNMFLTLWTNEISLTCGLGEKDDVIERFDRRMPWAYKSRFWAEF